MSSKFDIAIVGGGMVGLAMAASLAETELKILLIEKQNLSEIFPEDLLENKTVDNQDFDVRVSAISPANRELLQKFNAWQNIPQQRLANYQQMKVWDGDGTGKIDFSASQVAEQNLGVIVENRVIQAALLKRIQLFGNIQCVFGFELDDIQVSDNKVEIHLSNDHIYKSQLLIGADGANSIVRQKLDIESKQMSYEQTAFVANVKTEFEHQDTAWQRFTPQIGRAHV